MHCYYGSRVLQMFKWTLAKSNSFQDNKHQLMWQYSRKSNYWKPGGLNLFSFGHSIVNNVSENFIIRFAFHPHHLAPPALYSEFEHRDVDYVEVEQVPHGIVVEFPDLGKKSAQKAVKPSATTPTLHLMLHIVILVILYMEGKSVFS